MEKIWLQEYKDKNRDTEYFGLGDGHFKKFNILERHELPKNVRKNCYPNKWVAIPVVFDEVLLIENTGYPYPMPVLWSTSSRVGWIDAYGGMECRGAYQDATGHLCPADEANKDLFLLSNHMDTISDCGWDE